MNGKQKAILWCGAIVACIMIAYPPWLRISDSPYESHIKDYGYSFVAAPPTRQEFGIMSVNYTGTANAINMSRLGLQVAIVAILTGAGIATVRRTNDEGSR